MPCWVPTDVSWRWWWSGAGVQVTYTFTALPWYRIERRLLQESAVVYFLRLWVSGAAAMLGRWCGRLCCSCRKLPASYTRCSVKSGGPVCRHHCACSRRPTTAGSRHQHTVSVAAGPGRHRPWRRRADGIPRGTAGGLTSRAPGPRQPRSRPCVANGDLHHLGACRPPPSGATAGCRWRSRCCCRGRPATARAGCELGSLGPAICSLLHAAHLHAPHSHRHRLRPGAAPPPGAALLRLLLGSLMLAPLLLQANRGEASPPRRLRATTARACRPPGSNSPQHSNRLIKGMPGYARCRERQPAKRPKHGNLPLPGCFPSQWM